MSEAAKQTNPPVAEIEDPGDGYGPPCTYLLLNPHDGAERLVISVRVECPPGSVRVMPLGQIIEPHGPNPFVQLYKPFGFSGLKYISRLLVKFRPELEALTQIPKSAAEVEREQLYKALGD